MSTPYGPATGLVNYIKGLPNKALDAMSLGPLARMLGIEQAPQTQPWTPPQDGKPGATTLSAAPVESDKPRRKPISPRMGGE